MVCFVKSLILPELQKATCTGFNTSELECSFLLYTYRFELLNKIVNSENNTNTVYYDLQNDRH